MFGHSTCIGLCGRQQHITILITMEIFHRGTSDLKFHDGGTLALLIHCTHGARIWSPAEPLGRRLAATAAGQQGLRARVRLPRIGTVSSAPSPPPCASHPQLAAHDALMRQFQALTDSCDEQPFNSLSEHRRQHIPRDARTLHSAPHAHTPPRTRPCP